MSETVTEPTTVPEAPVAPVDPNAPVATAPAAPVVIPPKTARFKLPAGVVTPIELRNELVKQGIAPETLKPQQMYAYVKSPGKTNPFPVKFYEENGTVHDTQPGGILTRPGIPTMAEGIDWYKLRATAPVATAAPTTTPVTAVITAPEDESAPNEAATDLHANEPLEEAE
jgi:hypothetical protein